MADQQKDPDLDPLDAEEDNQAIIDNIEELYKVNEEIAREGWLLVIGTLKKMREIQKKHRESQEGSAPNGK